MYLFACDLDNTIIHSYKKAQESDICVEMKDEKKLSYMTQKSYKLLNEIYEKRTDILFVPLTTRTMEQYNRINLLDSKFPKYALAANGGILLIDNCIDEKWYEESLEIIKDSLNELKLSMDILEKDENIYIDIKIIDGLFVYTKSSNPKKTLSVLSKNIDISKVDVFENGDKVYVISKKLNKGAAVKRLKEKLNIEKTICAGDSLFDISMLNIADIAVYPENLKNNISNDNQNHIFNRDIFFAENLLSLV